MSRSCETKWIAASTSRTGPTAHCISPTSARFSGSHAEKNFGQGTVAELAVQSERRPQLQTTSKPGSGWRGRLALLVAGTLLGLAVSELVLRLLGPTLPARFTTLALQELHPVYGVFHR